MLKNILKILAIFFLILALFVLKTVYQAGTFKTIENKFEGSCQKINLVGVEDITIDQNTGIAFLSSFDRWSARLDSKLKKGGIYAFNLKLNAPIAIPLTTDFRQKDFHPHGISLYQSPEGKKILFVVSHRKAKDVVEIFEYKNDTLWHQETVSSSLLASPNDIVGVGERSFYVTNDHNEKQSTERTIKDYLMIGTGNVVYYDGKTLKHTGIKGIKYANGINVSADGKQLYLAATTARSISVFDRNIQTGALTKVIEIETGTGVDNIEIDTAGNLWVGCHPQLLKFGSHAQDENKLSPSEIIKITPLADGKYKQETVYLNDGSEISASAVGAVYGQHLLIGPVFERHFLWCELN